MKKAIIGLIIYFLILHVLLPSIYYLIYGFTPVYSDLEDENALIKSFCIIFFSFLIAIVLLYYIPSKNDKIAPHIDGKPLTVLYYFSILLKLAIVFSSGGFSALITGESNGTLLTYISLFLNPFTLLLTLLFVQKRKSNVILAIIFYVLSVTIAGSRSGIIAIFSVFLIGFAFEAFKFYRGKLSKFLKYGIIITPFLFIFATKLRGVDDFISMDVIMNQIVGRISVLETSMMPVYFYDNDLNLDLFYEKYSFWNQFLLSVDSLIPGQLFDYDVMPNNYYRAMFMGYSTSFVQENYMSVNFTLPIYLYLKYSYFTFFFTILYILGFYKFSLFFKRYPFVVIIILSLFFNLIYFFDWVMVFTQFYKAVLTILFLKAYLFFYRTILLNIKKNEYTS